MTQTSEVVWWAGSVQKYPGHWAPTGGRVAPVSHLCPPLSIPPGPLSLCPSPTIVKIDSTFLVSIMTKLSPAVQG